MQMPNPLLTELAIHLKWVVVFEGIFGEVQKSKHKLKVSENRRV